MNHVALSMRPEELEGDRRAEIVRFYEEVFGWSEYPLGDDYVEGFSKELTRLLGTEVAKHQPLVLLMGSGPFVFLYALENPIRATPADHFGFEVTSEEQLDAIVDRARQRANDDPEVRVSPKGVTPAEAGEGIAGHQAGTRVELVNCYIGYRLPFAVEVQLYRWCEEQVARG
jgi:hypothetical protein